MNRIAFNYNWSPDLSGANNFDVFVTDPDGEKTVNQDTDFYAYLSWYEIGPTDPYLKTGRKLIKEAQRRGIKVLARNPRWNSWIMDVANPKWHKLFMELVDDAVKKRYSGIYMDTWDGYGDIPGLGKKKKAKLLEANRQILETISATSDLGVIINRGWEVMELAATFTVRMLVESVWCSHDGMVDPGETREIIKKIRAAQDLGYEVNVLDYEPHGEVEVAEEICAMADSIECGCTVVVGSLTNPQILATNP